MPVFEKKEWKVYSFDMLHMTYSNPIGGELNIDFEFVSDGYELVITVHNLSESEIEVRCVSMKRDDAETFWQKCRKAQPLLIAPRGMSSVTIRYEQSVSVIKRGH